MVPGSRFQVPGSTLAIFVAVMAGSARDIRAQHVTADMAMTMSAGVQTEGCETRARQAATILDGLNASLERARQSGDEAQMRAALTAAQNGFVELKRRLEACRGGAPAQAASPPAVPAAGAMAGMDHSKMNMGGTKPPASTPQTAAPAGGAMAGMDHSKMNMGGTRPPASTPQTAAPAGGAMAGMDHSKMDMAGAAAAPTTVRQITGPAEDALQSFQDALQVGNRDVALHWLAPDVRITESGMTDASRDAYASRHMALDMTFLKTAKIVLIDRQVHPAGDSTHIVSTSRITGRAGEMPVDVTVTEGALLKKTSQGWRVASVEWTIEPVKQEAR